MSPWSLALWTFAARAEPYDDVVQVEVDTSTGQLVLTFDDRTGYSDIEIFKREPALAGDWYDADIPRYDLAGDALSWTDEDALPGEVWEYRVVRTGSGVRQFGFVTASLDAPLVDQRGTVLLIISESVAGSSLLAPGVLRLQQDIVGDGWDLVTWTAPASSTPPDVKTRILATDEAISGDLVVFLLGHVPVPYSGYIAPDGHTDHYGAWPADTYYAELDDDWTDTSVNSTSASRDQNDNVPGDGKFDQSTLPDDADIGVGRVDFYDMPTMLASEEELLARYLDKDHAWRHAQVAPERGALIDDNFGSYAPGAKSGWALAPLVGRDNLATGDWLTDLSVASYRWAYGCGGGSYTSAGGIGSTGNFAVTPLYATFTMIFGSYHGDWDSTDNFMRAAIAAEGHTLTVAWAGRPNWYNHHLGAGEPIGAVAQWSMNNEDDVDYGGNGVHIALLGDPTLRAWPLPPPGAVQVENEEQFVGVSWEPSAAVDLIGYHVYRSTAELGPYERLTDVPVTTTSYDDVVETEGTWWYLVRAVAMQTTPSGTFEDASQGAFGSVAVECEGEGTECVLPSDDTGGTPDDGDRGGGCGCASGASGSSAWALSALAGLLASRRGAPQRGRPGHARETPRIAVPLAARSASEADTRLRRPRGNAAGRRFPEDC